jgi:hypothetical protein
MSWETIIISNGQTSGDRAALKWAIEQNVPHGGWCPKGRATAAGPLDEKFQLRETETTNYLECTEANILGADGTVAFSLGPKAAGGTQKTISTAKKLKKPCLHLHQGILAVSEKLVAFMDKHNIRRLNVAGSDEGTEAGIDAWVTVALQKAKNTIDMRSISLF